MKLHPVVEKLFVTLTLAVLWLGGAWLASASAMYGAEPRQLHFSLKNHTAYDQFVVIQGENAAENALGDVIRQNVKASVSGNDEGMMVTGDGFKHGYASVTVFAVTGGGGNYNRWSYLDFGELESGSTIVVNCNGSSSSISLANVMPYVTGGSGGGAVAPAVADMVAYFLYGFGFMVVIGLGALAVRLLGRLRNSGGDV